MRAVKDVSINLKAGGKSKGRTGSQAITRPAAQSKGKAAATAGSAGRKSSINKGVGQR